MYRYVSIFSVLLLLFISTGCSGSSGSQKGNNGTTDKNLSSRNTEASVMTALESLTIGLPDDIREAILASPDDFIKRIHTVLDMPGNLYLQADKQHSLPADYVPPDLVHLTDYPELTLSRSSLYLRKILISELRRMVEDARRDGITLVISSTYRSYSYQDTVFKRIVAQDGLKQAERESAHPGTSQHQLGTAIDFGTITDDYADTPAGIWLMTNAWRYGFSLSYPNGYESVTGYRYECWHYRYISPEGASLQRDYFRDIQQYFIAFLNEHMEELKSL